MTRTFDGRTIEPQDVTRLDTQYGRVWLLMQDGLWRTLSEIASAVGGSEAGVSARLRDFRKPRNGTFVVDRKRLEGGLWAYRIPPGQTPVYPEPTPETTP